MFSHYVETGSSAFGSFRRRGEGRAGGYLQRFGSLCAIRSHPADFPNWMIQTREVMKFRTAELGKLRLTLLPPAQQSQYHRPGQDGPSAHGGTSWQIFRA